MPIEIFGFTTGGAREHLVVNDDGKLTWHTSFQGWAGSQYGSQPKEQTMSANEAKLRRPEHAADIDNAMAEIARPKPSN